MLRSLATTTPEQLLECWADGRIKLFVTQRLLRFRREHPALFEKGNYVPLTVTGLFADCCIAFAREHEGKCVVVFVPRVSSRVGFPPIGKYWQDTRVELPMPLGHQAAKDIFTGRDFQSEAEGISLAGAMATLPFAAYSNLL
jgi:(1->4)-alpha-D-glucan 1-alpha-D-glucosylmutase